MSQLLLLSLLGFVWLLLEGGYYSKGCVYFFGNPTDINDGWIRNIWVIQRQPLDATRSAWSLSVLLSAVEMNHTAQTVLALAC